MLPRSRQTGQGSPLAYLPADPSPPGGDPPPWYAYWGWKLAAINAMDDGSWLIIPQAQFGATADDGNLINYGLAQGQRVWLAPGLTYSLATQVVVPPGGELCSVNGFRSRGGATLQPVASFTGTSAVTFAANTPAGAIHGIQVDGSKLPGGNTVDGIAVLGGAKQWTIHDVNVQFMGGNGINISTFGGVNPDGGLLSWASLNNNTLDGLHWQYCVDSQAHVIHSDSNGQAGINLSNLNNSIIHTAKSQSNGTFGWNFTLSGSKPSGTMTSCFSEANGQDGFHSTNQLSNAGSMTFLGCKTNNDGASGVSGSGFAGFNLQVNKVDLAMVGCANFITTSASGPDYGLKLSNCNSQVVVSECSLLGSVAPYLDGGGITVPVMFLGNNYASGQSDTRTITNTPGPWSGQPAVPTSTTAQINAGWRDAAVTVTGGTVSAIAVDGTATGATSGTVIVPAGHTITLTYTVAPTWKWVLLT